MMKLITCYHPRFATSLIFMLQASEYRVSDYLEWFWRTPDLRRVARRGRLELTAKARLLLLLAYGLIFVEAVALGLLIWIGIDRHAWWFAAAALLLAAPLITVYGLTLVLWLGEVLVQRPKARAIIAAADAKLQTLPARRIAIAGSYGKTTFKENLRTILAEGKQVAATPGNMNTPLGISRFISRLTGDEDILIFELGEYYPGDIAELCRLVRPQLGVITGINEAHLSKFKTLEATTATIFELADYLGDQPVYKNGDSSLVRGRVSSDDPLVYDEAGVNGWKVSGVKTELTGTSFTIKKGRTTIHAATGLLGRHHIGPLVAAVDIAHELDLTPDQITAGLAATRPYEHRMEPRLLAGATIVDDTYNGNADGVRVGLDWLSAVEANRRIYITPGLVEQGSKAPEIHQAIGERLAPITDVVVLMRNSVTPYIEAGLTKAGFKGQLKWVDDPVKFYAHLDQFVAKGDVVLMQNDWTDNYA